MQYFAHSAVDKSQEQWQLLATHLSNVGDIASTFASVFGAADAGKVIGLLHDLGKYTQEFQARLHGQRQRVDHSTQGAQIALHRFGPIGQILAYGIAGHHAGLANGMGTGERTALAERLAAQLPPLDPIWEHEVTLPADLNAPEGFTPYGTTRQESKARGSFQLAFLTRMLFSCLVDADYIDTERFYQQIEGSADHRQRCMPSLADLRAQLDFHLAGFTGDSKVNRLRAHILAHARAQAGHEPGMFSLTVPTGGGKTLTSFAFALDHAIQHGLERVIFVIPYTSIVEQTAQVFRRVLGPLGEDTVLEHHSAFIERPPHDNDPEKYQARQKLRLAMENWDAPIVVTTAVQFFESLFAAHPSRCRKLHNIAGSVVVLDEAQTMPLNLIKPCVAAIDELARNYHTSLVLCTATQPVLEAPEFEGGLTNVRELAPEPVQLFKQLKRVHVRHVGSVNDEWLVSQMREHEQILVIVNNRSHARTLYRAIDAAPGAFHLTTLMCARHRSKTLNEIRLRLKKGLPCRLVSTSLIEAGVDVDFPIVLRAEAGLDSIAQAAGRCNREGLRTPATSEVMIFATDNPDWIPPVELKQYAQTAHEVLRDLDRDPLSPDAIRAYFTQLYWQKGDQSLDSHDLLGLLARSRPDSLPMEILAQKFRMIEDTQVPVIIPWDDTARALVEQLKFAEGCARVARRLQPYLVQVHRNGFDALRSVGAIIPVAPDKWEEQFMVLAHEGLYDRHCGLSWDQPNLIGTEYLNW
ncbi:CRISPR-associated helicase Cas3' [Castellaniella sp.]|uniref:CRISPR-associated helicase Cas3' n=1 Tax=Castellaniella sp. TaxID=1955812 RepID=UPI00355F7102